MTFSPTAIVTGASRGLGRGIALQLVAAGYTVIAAARTAPEIDGAVNVAADVTTEAGIAALLRERSAGIALLVNNAAAPPVLDSLEDLTPERFRLGFEVDVFGALALTQAAAPYLDGGTVVNVISAKGGTPAGPAHLSVSPSQSALTALTRNLAVIMAPQVTVHGLMPALTPAGGTGVIAAPALGVTFGDVTLTAEQVGDAVLALTEEREPGIWFVDANQLSMVTSVPIGV
ncbi:SDR family oxidoreductase [Solirubrobacter ginsenosidimutans]|uniref:SDR family oxidoreductase n=1 Tax=Solirubrobacter ginsenosidimutans TaxID=490573 RepID=A0A9X3N5H6_9ACTN|nr:SDR family oxidoreductase [Solirubrobacter ginsenosidimutans]MDA0166972.1 SDR family oxidoreductase [Solirubrobacter ginsenosidimutans]